MPWRELARPAWAALALVVLLTVGDAALRGPTLVAWSGFELRQYAMSALGSVGFWWGLAALVLLAGCARWALAAGAAVGTAVLFLPLAYFVVYRRFPNEDAFVFFANEWRFVFRTAATGALGMSVVLAMTCGVALAAWLSFATRKVARWTAWVGLAALVIDVTVIAASSFSFSLPLTVDQLSVRLVTRLISWRGSPPPFFQLYERAPGVVSRPVPALPFNVLWVVHETVGAPYLQTPDGRAVAPAMLALRDDDAVVWLSRLHTVSSCTDVSLPAILSGISSGAPLDVQLSARLPFDVAREAGAYVFLASSQRLDWAGLNRYLGGPFDFIKGAEYFDPAAEDLGVKDALAWTAALDAMDDAARQGKRFMGLVRSNGTHGPYRVDPDDSPWAQDPGFGLGTTGGFVNYLNALHLVDREFGEFWRSLRTRPWFDDTLVIMTADHGEAFAQHGTLWHCGDFTPEESWVPGALRLPRAVRAHAALVERLKAHRSQVLPTTDLAPTVADLLGWTDFFPGQFDGVSLLTAPSTQPFTFTNCSELRRCPSADFGVFDGRRRWIYSAETRRWRSWDELEDPLAAHELPDSPGLRAAFKVRIDASRDAALARRVVGW